MENKANNQLSISTSKIVETLKQELTVFAEIQGRHTALQNKPATKEEYEILLLRIIEQKANAAIAKNQEEMAPISGAVLVNTLEKQKAKQTAQLTAEEQEKELKIGQVEEEKKQYCPDRKLKLKRIFVTCLLALVSITEGYFAFEAMVFNGYPLWAAIITATVTAFGMGAITHVAAKKIKDAKNKVQWFGIFSLTAISISVFLGFLGKMRAEGYVEYAKNLKLKPVENNTALFQTASATTITTISIFIFIFILLISIFYSKSKKEEQQETLYNKLNDETEKLKKEKDAIVKHKSTVIEKFDKEINAVKINFEKAVAREKLIKAVTYDTPNIFNTTNIRHRPDKLIPSFMAETPTLQLNLFFDNLNNNQQ